jgi:hypothetical protein
MYSIDAEFVSDFPASPYPGLYTMAMGLFFLQVFLSEERRITIRGGNGEHSLNSSPINQVDFPYIA